MEPVDALIHARWIIPVEPVGRVLERHALVVRHGRIVALLPSDDARTRYAPAESVELPHHVLIPGLVNAHTHAAMTLLRGLADDLPLEPWLKEHIWPAEARWVSADFVRDGTELAVAEMLRSGTTCFNDMYFFPEAAAQAARQQGMRASIGLIMFDFPSAWGSGPDDYLRKGLELRDQYKNDPLLSFVFAPHSAYTVSERWLKELRTLADELDLPLQTHLHETATEVADSLHQHGMRPIARLTELGMFTPALMAVHMTQLTDAEIAECAQNGVSVIHCPQSNLKLASGFCPVAKLLKAGVNVALGTDGAASNNDLDLLAEMQSAALLAKGVSGDAAAVPAATALSMATLNGAKALGLDKDIGSLLPGKWADMTAVDLSGPETQPVHDVLSSLVYSADRHQVSDVWVAGRRLLQDHVLTQMDLNALLERTAAWGERIGTTRDGQRKKA
ncbi:MAG TPA: TRZ/ATZ family hydrolase [Gammaproteobacteria bacterium]|jgi:5-methylthioadenosine/S-adenosylhomocysteine deaminase|nr:TRZ/ATZ family hydrolase [Gammaproteobacteria bacterium]